MFGLEEALELQAGFAGHEGHRHAIGRFFMSVNRRDEYHFIPPHSEGDPFIGMQLAAFYCYENSTDGGETILMNVDQSSAAWPRLKERRTKARVRSGGLSPQQVQQARVMYRLNLPADTLEDGDEVLHERAATHIPGLTVLSVLTRPRTVFSRILQRQVYTLWDSISSADRDCGIQYASFLKQWGLLKEPPGGMDDARMDNAHHRRVWTSGVDYSTLFRCRVTLKLRPGDLIVMNNATWTHSASNWTPGFGARNVAAAFA
jgi:hypothetical protein